MKPLHLLLVVLVAGILGGGARDLTGFFQAIGDSAGEARAELADGDSGLRANGAGDQTPSTSDCRLRKEPVVVLLRRNSTPTVIAHIRRAQRAGFPRMLTLRRDLARNNWNQATRGHSDLGSIDIWPLAASREAKGRVSRARVSPRENDRAGRQISRQLKTYCNGQRFQVKSE